MKIVQEIYDPDLNRFVTSTRSCKESHGYILESRYGKLTLDFSEINAAQCILLLHRMSGNGKIQILHHADKQVVLVTSKTRHEITIDLNKSKIININRTDICTGEVKLFGAILYDNDDVIIEEPSINWTSIINKCGKKHRISLVDNRLFASEGGYFENSSIIKEIQTLPPNKFNIKNNKLIFNGPCEIIKMVLQDNTEAAQPFPSFESPQPLTPSLNKNITPPKVPPLSGILRAPNDLSNIMDQNRLVFDSAENSLQFNMNTATAKNGNIYSLNHKGAMSVPVANLEPNTKYIAILTGQKVTGNGKISFKITAGDTIRSESSGVLNEMNISLFFRLDTGDPPVDQSYKLIIARPIGSTGQININRVALLKDLNFQTHYTTSFLQGGLIPGYYDFGVIEVSDKFTVIENDMSKIGVYEMPKKDELKFVMVVPSYKNSEWVTRNIESMLTQKGDNYRVIFIDDCSPDDTFDKAIKLIEQHNAGHKVTAIKNTERQGALCNLYNAIHSCEDDEIIVTVDGDDWLAHDKVIEKLSDVYANSYVWMTYGQYRSWPDDRIGCSQQVPAHIVNNGLYRQYRWCTSHLRTFYTWLFKKIKKEDLLDKHGKFYPMAWDLGFQLPMLECSGPHATFISDVLYIYNVKNPINDSKVNLKLQQDTEREIRAKPKYNRL